MSSDEETGRCRHRAESTSSTDMSTIEEPGPPSYLNRTTGCKKGEDIENEPVLVYGKGDTCFGGILNVD